MGRPNKKRKAAWQREIEKKVKREVCDPLAWSFEDPWRINIRGPSDPDGEGGNESVPSVNDIIQPATVSVEEAYFDAAEQITGTSSAPEPLTLPEIGQSQEDFAPPPVCVGSACEEELIALVCAIIIIIITPPIIAFVVQLCSRCLPLTTFNYRTGSFFYIEFGAGILIFNLLALPFMVKFGGITVNSLSVLLRRNVSESKNGFQDGTIPSSLPSYPLPPSHFAKHDVDPAHHK